MVKRYQGQEFWRTTAEPDSLISMARLYFEWMQTYYAPSSIIQCKMHLRYFIQFCHERAITTVEEVTRSLIDTYQRYLYQAKSVEGRPFSPAYRCSHLNSVACFFEWLARNHYLFYNPAGAIDMPKIPKRIPQQTLTAEEAERIINQPNTSTPKGIRDRAMLETFYSTGILRGELAGLKFENLNFEQGSIMVMGGMGLQNREIPIGDRALEWIKTYLCKVRANLPAASSQDALFLNPHGNPFNPKSLSHLVTTYVKKAGIQKKGSTLLFRYTMAVLMLENGADVRYVQQMLGHVCLENTQRYAKMAIQKLLKVHARTHPAKIKPSKTEEILREVDQ